MVLLEISSSPAPVLTQSGGTTKRNPPQPNSVPYDRRVPKASALQASPWPEGSSTGLFLSQCGDAQLGIASSPSRVGLLKTLPPMSMVSDSTPSRSTPTEHQKRGHIDRPPISVSLGGKQLNDGQDVVHGVAETADLFASRTSTSSLAASGVDAAAHGFNAHDDFPPGPEDLTQASDSRQTSHQTSRAESRPPQTPVRRADACASSPTDGLWCGESTTRPPAVTVPPTLSAAPFGVPTGGLKSKEHHSPTHATAVAVASACAGHHLSSPPRPTGQSPSKQPPSLSPTTRATLAAQSLFEHTGRPSETSGIELNDTGGGGGGVGGAGAGRVLAPTRDMTSTPPSPEIRSGLFGAPTGVGRLGIGGSNARGPQVMEYGGGSASGGELRSPTRPRPAPDARVALAVSIASGAVSQHLPAAADFAADFGSVQVAIGESPASSPLRSSASTGMLGMMQPSGPLSPTQKQHRSETLIRQQHARVASYQQHASGHIANVDELVGTSVAASRLLSSRRSRGGALAAISTPSSPYGFAHRPSGRLARRWDGDAPLEMAPDRAYVALSLSPGLSASSSAPKLSLETRVLAPRDQTLTPALPAQHSPVASKRPPVLRSRPPGLLLPGGSVLPLPPPLSPQLAAARSPSEIRRGVASLLDASTKAYDEAVAAAEAAHVPREVMASAGAEAEAQLVEAMAKEEATRRRATSTLELVAGRARLPTWEGRGSQVERAGLYKEMRIAATMARRSRGSNANDRL